MPYTWVCGCGRQCQASVWRVVSHSERPDAFTADAPGLVTVGCEGCGGLSPIDDAVALEWPAQSAPLVVALARWQLDDPGAVLAEMRQHYKGRLRERPVLVPRDRLPLLLSRDVDADAGDRIAAVAAVLAETGDVDAAEEYGVFHKLVSAAGQDPSRLLDQLLDQVRASDQRSAALARWLHAHPEVHGSERRATLEGMAGRAEADGDAASGESLRILQRLLDQVAGGAPTEAAVAEFEQALVEHNSAVYLPHLEELFAAAESGPVADGIVAARELVARLEGHPDPAGPLRYALVLLGTRLMQLHESAADDEALMVLERARELSLTRDEIWVQATGNAGAAYTQRTVGDAARDWVRGVQLLRDALVSPEADARSRGINATNLGLALSMRPGGSTDGDLDEAVECLEQALADRPVSAGVEDWAFTKVNLAMALRRRANGDGLSAAAGHLRDVTAALRVESLPRMLVHAQLNLASVLLDLDPPEPAAALVACAEGAAAAVDLGEPFLVAWAARLEGSARAAVAGRQDDSAAVAAWERSIDVPDDSAHATQLLDNGWVLAGAYEATGQWEPLARLYERMLAALDLVYQSQTTPQGRRHWLAAHPLLARWAAYAMVHTGRVEAAVDALERARARGLAAATGREPADLHELDRADPHLAGRFRDATLAVLSAAAAASPDLDASAAADAALRDVVGQVRAVPGMERFLLAPPIGELLRASGAGRVVYILCAIPGSYLISVELDPSGEPVYAARHIPVSSGDIVRVVVFDMTTGAPGLIAAQTVDNDGGVAFADALDRAASELAPLLEAFIEVAAAPAPGGGPTVVVQTGLTGLLPLQALPRPDGTCLDDVAAVRLAPSLAVYVASRRRGVAVEAMPPVLVAVANPTEDLPGARAEVDTIGALPGWAHVHAADGQDATVAWLAAHAPAATHLHLSCHGEHSLDPSTGGALVLADGLLPTHEIARLRLSVRVAVASACQSGHFDAAELPDEFVGIAGALLEAGSACAVATLWPVGDEAAALLMTRFYELLNIGGMGTDPAEALREARLWLRDLTGADRDAWLADRPVLAAALRARGLPAKAGSRGQGPYAGVGDWGAFVAHGA